MKLFSLTLAALVASGTAFVVPMQRTACTAAPLQQSQQLSEIDEMCIENVAETCLRADEALAGECDLEEHQALLNQLQDQKEILEKNVARIDNLLHRLKGDGLETPEPEQTYFPG